MGEFVLVHRAAASEASSQGCPWHELVESSAVGEVSLAASHASHDQATAAVTLAPGTIADGLKRIEPLTLLWAVVSPGEELDSLAANLSPG